MIEIVERKVRPMLVREFHDLAAAFKLLEGDEFKALMEDIKSNGLNEPVMIYEDKVLDGRNRYRACRELGIAPSEKKFSGSEQDAKNYVISVNIHRRHLSNAEKRKLIEKLLIDNPQVSDRSIGRTVKASEHTVADVRKKSSAQNAQSKTRVKSNGTVFTVDKKPSKTTRKAKQPATSTPEPNSMPGNKIEYDQQLRDQINVLMNEKHNLEMEVLALKDQDKSKPILPAEPTIENLSKFVASNWKNKSRDERIKVVDTIISTLGLNIRDWVSEFSLTNPNRRKK